MTCWKSMAMALLIAATGHGAKAEMLTAMVGDAGARPSQGRLAAAPLAYQLFCLRLPEECRAGDVRQVRYTAALAAELERVNRAVNRAIRFAPERTDTWRSDAGTGDCEDYALAKRKRLIERGVPAGALRLAVARNSRGEGHAVLIVRTSRGDLVLDNAREPILRRQDTGYRWLGMASADPRRWNRLPRGR